MTNPSPPLAFLLVVLRPAVLLAYRLVIRGAAWYLARDLSATSVYVAGTGASGELVVGLSDIDLVVVLGGGSSTVERERDVVLARWRWLRRALRGFTRAIGIALYVEEDLADEDGATVFTYGLGARGPAQDTEGGYLRRGRPVDDLYRRLHPGIYGPGRTWRLVQGRRRTPGEPVGSAEYRRLAAWLELQWWWRFAFELCTNPDPAFASYIAFKLVAEPARIWVWLADGRRVKGRREAIERALVLLPEEEDVLRGALTLHHRLPRAADPPRAQTLEWLLRIGDRIAALLEAEILVHGTSEVRLVDGDLVLGREAREASERVTATALRREPLVDWRARSMPRLADEALLALEIDPADPLDLARVAQHAVGGMQPAVRTDRLLVLPADAFSDGILLRSVQFAASDPVSFALLDRRRTASFPQVRGFSASDSARRAVDEHASWLALTASEEPTADGGLDLLFTATRAALLSESIDGGDPQLPLTVEATVACLGDRRPETRSRAEDAYAAFREQRTYGTPVPALIVRAFRGVVESLPSYTGAP
jgi:hypothetical protein